jgi:RNA recognition motif-containing protein
MPPKLNRRAPKPTPDSHKPGQLPDDSPFAKLFVGHLPFETSEEQLMDLFGHYGRIEGVHIIRDRRGVCTGAAFVTYTSTAEADTAIYTLHDRYKLMTNKFLQVSYAKSSPNLSEYGRTSAMEVHQQHPDANPIPDAF